MVYAVQALVGFRNTARRDAVKANVQTRLAQNVPWGEVTITNTIVRPSRNPAFYAEVRFNTKAEQQAFWSDLNSFLGSGVNGPTTGSEWWGHDCRDDGTGGACQRDPAMQGST